MSRKKSYREHRADLLTTYLDEAGAIERLDPEQERAQARALVELRRECWRAALADPERHDAFVQAVHDRLGRAPEALEAWRDGQGTVDDVIDAMSDADPDAVVLDHIAASCSDDEGSLYAQRLRRARAAYTRARNRFMCSHLRLVVSVAKRFGRHHMPLSDRVQAGNLGLLRAIDRFDPERGCRLSTYAAWWIRHAVTRSLVQHGRTVRIPAHIHTLFTKVRRARKDLRGALGRTPTSAEIAEHIDAPLDKVESAVEAMELRSVGLDAPVAAGSTQTIADVLPDDTWDAWTDRIGERIDARLADEVVDGLGEMERDIVVHRFGLRGEPRRTLRSLGEDYDLSRERIRQLQQRALGELRAAIETGPRASVAVA